MGNVEKQKISASREVEQLDIKGAMQYLSSPDWRKSRLGLERMAELLERMENPQRRLRFVHVAETNGKGSVCAMLASVLAAAGYKTGLYTSPYINRFNERIQVNGESIPDAALAEITRRVRICADEMADHPTAFELITAIGFQYFFEMNCAIVMLEVGLGGHLDATNIIGPPEAAVITPVSLDHVAELGDTVEKIAAEKGGIIKTGCDVVVSPQQPGVMAVLKEICSANGATLYSVDTSLLSIIKNTTEGQVFRYGQYKDYMLQLLGACQPQNAAVVITIVDRLRKKGWKIDDTALRKGLAAASWPARFEIVHRNPWVVVDGGHNPQCAGCVTENLRIYFPGQKATFIIGVMADKDYDAMFRRILPLAKRIFAVTPDNPRALSAGELTAYFRTLNVEDVTSCGTVEQGLDMAMTGEPDNGLICTFGSLYIAGAIRRQFGLS
jgi:dihydrofolate synthase/folylpolyglutamate synthase